MSQHTLNENIKRQIALDKFVQDQVGPVQTTSGSRSTYRSPVEVVQTDAGFVTAFKTGFQATYDPGPELPQEKQIKLTTPDQSNEFVGDLKNNDALTISQQNAYADLATQHARSNRKGRSKLLQQYQKMKLADQNLANILGRAGDDELYDVNASNGALFLSLDDNPIKDLTLREFAEISNTMPSNIRKTRAQNKNGEMVEGFDVQKPDGSIVFINTQAMDESYLNTQFGLRDNLNADISAYKPTDAVRDFLDKPEIQTRSVEARDADGNIKTTEQKIVSDNYYSTAENEAINFAARFSDIKDEGFLSAFKSVARSINNGKFTSNVDIPENFKNFANNDALIADMLEENPALALEIERDYTAEIFKIKQASVGYTIGQDGRAKEINTRVSDVQTELPSQGAGSGSGNAKLNEAAVQNIEELDISSAFAEGPSQEPGRGVLNLNTLEKLISRPPYNINVVKAETVGGEDTRKLTKSVEGADRSVTIFDSATDGEVKAALKFLETGTSFKPTANVKIDNIPNLP